MHNIQNHKQNKKHINSKATAVQDKVQASLKPVLCVKNIAPWTV